ncbi:unnamed protein product [Schistosoma curassoni]|uniref:Uncharacterized protein n=1 Tax=Schistosoma curassoni TaxID=6186 RepID=A0A183KIV9_9TREM|nr:unnamed protein product [Schistosoma curassoni]
MEGCVEELYDTTKLAEKYSRSEEPVKNKEGKLIDFFKMLGNALKITILLIAWTSHYSAQFDLKNYPNIPGYYGEDLSEELVKSKLKDSELYDRYRIRRHFMPQRFGKRYTILDHFMSDYVGRPIIPNRFRNAVLASPMLPYMSASHPPGPSMTLPRYVKDYTSPRVSASSAIGLAFSVLYLRILVFSLCVLGPTDADAVATLVSSSAFLDVYEIE